MMIIEDRIGNIGNIDNIDSNTNIKDNNIKNNTKYNSGSNTKDNNIDIKDNNILNNILDCNNSILNFKETTPNPLPLPLKGEGELRLYSFAIKGEGEDGVRNLHFKVERGIGVILSKSSSIKDNNIDNFSSIFNFSKSAFSLIELSIVLIIIGLLIAGITGGASLIQSAKVRSMINELKDYERAVYTFQAAKGRYPGDVMNYGTFGVWSNYYNGGSGYSAQPYYTYKESDFPSEFITEFQKTAGSGVIPNYYSAPFVELYNEGIIDFKPLGNVLEASKNNTKKGTPSLKSEPKAHIYFNYTGSHPDYKQQPCEKDLDDGKCIYYSGIAYSGQLKQAIISTYSNSSSTKGFDPKFLKAVDNKIDDGWYNTGIFRSRCYGSNSNGRNSYENAMESGKRCRVFFYAM